ncbi:Phytochrome [Dactylella cylindrospora]|nr:Phytochrome [Dactylella cylindrospora]
MESLGESEGSLYQTYSDCYNSANLLKNSETELHSDFISLLSAFQENDVDIIPTTWQPGFGLLGRGGQGTVNQSQISLRHSFGFKRIRETESGSPSFAGQITEITVLCAEGIRDNPHIINIEGICWEVSSKPDRVLPVFIFEKSDAGDLVQFLESAQGQQGLTFQDRLQLCIEIGLALVSLHDRGIVHTDIKPENVLVFGSENGSFSAKLADLSSASICERDTDVIYLKGTPLWAAPEYDHRGISLDSAKKCDIYSFGVMCLFVLSPAKETSVANWLHGVRERLQRPEADLDCCVDDLITDCEDKDRGRLYDFFRKTLAFDPEYRSLEIRDALRHISMEK